MPRSAASIRRSGAFNVAMRHASATLDRSQAPRSNEALAPCLNAGMTDQLVEARKALCEREGGYKPVANAIEANDQTIYQIVAGVQLPSGKPRGVGRQLRERLDRRFPGWAGSTGAAV